MRQVARNFYRCLLTRSLGGLGLLRRLRGRSPGRQTESLGGGASLGMVAGGKKEREEPVPFRNGGRRRPVSRCDEGELERKVSRSPGRQTESLGGGASLGMVAGGKKERGRTCPLPEWWQETTRQSVQRRASRPDPLQRWQPDWLPCSPSTRDPTAGPTSGNT